MSARLYGHAACLFLLLSCVALSANAYEHRTLSYGQHPEQSVDLYLPESTATPLTLVVVRGELWDASPATDRLTEDLLRFWTQAGLRVAQVWYRRAPAAEFPAQAEDLAAAMARIQQQVEVPTQAGRYLCLLGQSSGAHLAAVTALDPRYLREVGVSPRRLAGVIGISGIFDLTPEYNLYERQQTRYARVYGDAQSRSAASPVSMDNRDIPTSPGADGKPLATAAACHVTVPRPGP
jgi:acetyl esterase/lipase